MTERDIQEIIKSVSEMARRVGAVFIPDPKKIAAIRRTPVTRPMHPPAETTAAGEASSPPPDR